MVQILKNSNSALQTVVNKLRNGGIVCFPTETVYALACDACNEDAITKIYKLKQRHFHHPLSLLVNNVEQVKQIAYIDDKIEAIINKFSPGAITYILHKKTSSGLSSLVNSVSNTIGIRIPKHDIAQAVLELFIKPIIATSTNVSGKKSASSVDEIDPVLAESIDIIIDGGKTQYSTDSTVIDLTDSKKIRILREGVIKLTE